VRVRLAHDLVHLPEQVCAVLPDRRHAGHELLVTHARLEQRCFIVGHDVTLEQGQIRFDDGDFVFPGQFVGGQGYGVTCDLKNI
jgi:hypothetical protein